MNEWNLKENLKLPLLKIVGLHWPVFIHIGWSLALPYSASPAFAVDL